MSGYLVAAQFISHTRQAVTCIVARHADGRIVRTAYPSRLDAEVRLATIAEDNRQAMVAAGFPEMEHDTDDRPPVKSDRLPGNYICSAKLETTTLFGA